MPKGSLRIDRALLVAFSGEPGDDIDKKSAEIIKGVREGLVKKGCQKTIDNVRTLTRKMLDMTNAIKLPPRKATLEDWNSQEVKDFLTGKMPEGFYNNEDDLLVWINEWNNEKDKDEEETLAEAYEYTLTESIGALKKVFDTTSLAKIFGILGFQKIGYRNPSLLRKDFQSAALQDIWIESSGEGWEKLVTFFGKTGLSLPDNKKAIVEYMRSLYSEGKKVTFTTTLEYLGLPNLEESPTLGEFSVFAERLRSHEKYSEILEAIEGWDTIIEICKKMNANIEKGEKKMPTTKQEIRELCKKYDVRYKDQRITFDTLVRFLGKSEESKKTAPREVAPSSPVARTIDIPTFRPVTRVPEADTLRRGISQVVSDLGAQNGRKKYSKNCTKNDGGTRELSLPNGTKEEITRYFLETVEGTPKWQKLLSPIGKEEEQSLGIRELAKSLNSAYEISEKRGFFFPSTIDLYEEIFELPTRKKDYTISDIILAITGGKSPSEKRGRGRPPGSSTKVQDTKPATPPPTGSSLSVSGALSKEDKEARVNTGKALFRRDIGLIAGMELGDLLLLGATYEVHTEPNAIIFTCSKEEANSQKTTEIWRKVLTADGISALGKKGYVYSQSNSLLSRTSSDWTYAMYVPRIRSSGTTRPPAHHVDASGDAMDKVQSEVTKARSEFEGIINTVLGNYYNRLVTNKSPHIPSRSLLKIDFNDGLSTDVNMERKKLTIHYNHGHDVKHNLTKEVLQSLQPREFTGCTISGGANETRIVEYKTKNDWTVSFRLNY